MATIVTRGAKGSSLTHSEADANFTNLNDQLNALSTTVTSLGVEVDTNYSTFTSGLASLNTEVDANYTTLSNLSTTVTTLTNTVNSNYSTLNSSISSLGTNVTSLSNSVTTLSGTVSSNYTTLNSGITTLTTNLATANAEIDANYAELSTEIDDNYTELSTSVALMPRLIKQLYAPITRTSDNTNDTVFVFLESVIIPGGLMGPNGKLVIIQDWDFTTDGTSNTNNVKTLAIDWGGDNIGGPTFTTTAQSVKLMTEIINANSLYSQRIMNSATFSSVQTAAHIVKTKDTSSNVTVEFKVKWGANNSVTQTITLLGYSIWLYPGTSF